MSDGGKRSVSRLSGVQLAEVEAAAMVDDDSWQEKRSAEEGATGEEVRAAGRTSEGQGLLYTVELSSELARKWW